MKTPEEHPREAERLKALRRLNVLDTPTEERFERITRSARRQLKAPMAAISLIDATRQWLKSEQGLSICETSRSESFCGHTILQDQLMVVEDARADERFSGNPAVTGAPFIRFYAGVPLKDEAGLPLGALCVMDKHPRSLKPREEKTLADLALAAQKELLARMPGASQQALAADRARRANAGLDSLTQLWGREAILEILEREHASARKEGQGLGAIFVNLDDATVAAAVDLEAGPELMRGAARRLVRAARAQDALGRFGGAEFLTVVRTSDRAELAAIAQGMRARLLKTPVKSGRRSVPVSASLGAAWAPAKRLSEPGQLLDIANDALCSAQRRGGNRVEVRAL